MKEIWKCLKKGKYYFSSFKCPRKFLVKLSIEILSSGEKPK